MPDFEYVIQLKFCCTSFVIGIKINQYINSINHNKSHRNVFLQIKDALNYLNIYRTPQSGEPPEVLAEAPAKPSEDVGEKSDDTKDSQIDPTMLKYMEMVQKTKQHEKEVSLDVQCELI